MPDYTNPNPLNLQPYREPAQPDPFEGPSYDDLHPGWRERAMKKQAGLIPMSGGPWEEEKNKREKLESIYSEEMQAHAQDAMHRGYLPGARPSDYFKERVQREMPDLHPADLQDAVDAFDKQAPQAFRNKQFRDVLAQEKTERYQNPLAGAPRAAMEEVGRLSEGMAGGLNPISTVENLRLARAQDRLREGKETEDDRHLLARHLISEDEQARASTGMNIWKAVSPLPSQMIGLQATGNVGGMLGAGASGEALAQGAAMSPEKITRRLIPGMELDEQGNPVVGPQRSVVGAIGGGVSEGMLDAALMHGVGQAAKPLRAAMGLNTGAAGALEKAGFYGPVEAMMTGRAQELAKRGLGLSENLGQTEELLSGDPERQKKALTQMGAEGVAFWLLGAGEHIQRGFTERFAQAKKFGLSDPDAVRQATLEMKAMRDRFEGIQAQNADWMNQVLPGERQRLPEQVEGELGPVARTAGRGLAPWPETQAPASRGERSPGPWEPQTPLPRDRSLVPYQDNLPVPVREGPNIWTPGAPGPEPAAAKQLPYDPRLNPRGWSPKTLPPEPDVDLHQPPGGWTDPRVIRAMQRRRAGLNLPEITPNTPTTPERSQGPSVAVGEDVLSAVVRARRDAGAALGQSRSPEDERQMAESLLGRRLSPDEHRAASEQLAREAQGPSQANPWGTYQPPLPVQAKQPEPHPLVKAGVFSTPEEAADLDRQARPLIDRLNGQSWSKGLNQLVDSYDFDNDAERETLQHYLGALAEGAQVPNGQLRAAEAQAQQDLAQEVQKAGANGAPLKEKLDALSPAQPRPGQSGGSDEALLERPGRTGTSTSSGVNKTAPTPRSNGTNRPMGRSLSNRIGDALTHEEVGTESEIIQHLKQKARAADRPFGPQEMKAVLAELDAMVQRGDLERHQSRKTADNPDPEPIYVPKENLEGEKGEPLSPADIEKAKQALYDQTRLAQKAFEQSKDGPAATLRGQAGGNELTGDLGQDLERLGRVDTKELDPLANSGALGKHGIWNEHFRRLAVALKEWESGPKSLFARRIAEGRIGQVEDALPKVVAALREAGNDKAADFYERNIPAAAEALRQRINPSGPSGNDLTDYQRGAAREIAPEASRRHEADITEYKRQTSLVREVLMRLRKFGFLEANPIAGPGNLQKKYGTKDANAIPGLDDLAKSYADNEPEKFGRDPKEAEEKIFNLLVGEQPAKPDADSYARHFENVKAERAEQMRNRYEARPAEAADFEPRGDANDAGLHDPGASEVEPGVNFFFGGRTGRQPPAPRSNGVVRGNAPTSSRSLGLAQPPGEGLWGKAVSIGRALKSVFNPAAISETSQATAGNLRERLSMMERLKGVAAETLYQGKAYFDRAVVAEKDPQTRQQKFLAFTDPYESGQHQQLPAEQQAIAGEIKRLKDEVTAELANRGLLQSFIANHLGHLWRDPNSPNASPESLGARVAARRPMEGAQGFKKQRQMPTWRDGIAAGLEPATWNPIEAELSRLGEMYKAIAGRDVYDEEKSQGRMKYVPLGGTGPQGWKPLDDKAGKVFAPPTVNLKEYVDKQQMEGLENFARGIGVNLSRPTRGMGGALGYQIPGKPSVANPRTAGEIATRFGTPEEVLAHEIGHEIDTQYPQLRKNLKADPAAWQGLERLADLRASGQVSQAHQNYLRSPSERVANLVAAYIHAPELLQNVAPEAHRILENQLSSTARLQDLMSIKPSLEIGQREQAMRLAGPQLVGQYWVPAESATLINRYLEPGLRGTEAAPAYQAFMGVANEMNKLSLGLSAFHALMTAGNSQATSLDVALRQVLSGNFGKSTAVNLLEAAPLASTVHDFLVGHKMTAEWFKPGSQGAETAMLLDAFMKSGGRARMGSEYGFDAIERFRQAIRQKAGALPILGNGLRAFSEALAYPIMQQLVPKVKMGAWARMARFELEKLGPNATVDQQRAVLYRQWQSVENRMGQISYSNLFWDRTLRGVMHGAVRSVGWNAGSIGEFGGAVADLPSSTKSLLSGKGISPRVSYAIALSMTAALNGALLQYLMTGKGPEEPKDLYFPKTGQKNRDGTDERLATPSYTKDIAALTNRGNEPFAYPENALRMVKGKVNPLAAATYEWWNNEDWNGAAIRDPKDPIQRQAMDEAENFLGHFVPISVLQAKKQEANGAGLGRQAAGFLGYTAAPSYITHSWEQQRMAEDSRKVTPTPLQKKRLSDQRRGLKTPTPTSNGLRDGR